MTAVTAVRPVLSDDVAHAREAGRPIVVLESAVIAHGLPYPRNLEAERRMRAAVEAEGAVPAVAAILRGALRIGLVEKEVIRLADGNAIKASVRDLAVVMAQGLNGALTVSATVAAAHLVGLPIVATGGTGGVHRGWAHSFDVSNDLHEMARTPVAVVASGVKSVLDIRPTLERLETLGVPVVGFGTREMPGFLVRETGVELEHTVADAEACARLLDVHWNVLARPSGVLICNPAPADRALPRELVQGAVDKAVAQAEAAGVAGKGVTPFLLRRLDNLTDGGSLDANLALLECNARVAATIARAVAAAP